MLVMKICARNWFKKKDMYELIEKITVGIMHHRSQI